MSSPAGQAPPTNIPNNHKAASMRQPSLSDSTIQTQPTRPPGLLPLTGERLWKPHEDEYWASIRDMWGSDVDPAETHDNDERHRSVTLEHHEASQYDSKEDMRDTDLCTENGAVFRIVLPNKQQHATAERDNNHVLAGGRTSPEGTVAGAPRPSINHRPLTEALALHLPPPALKRPNNNHSKGRRAFAGSALHVTVVTTTRTYGDFSKMNPPPYTPRPTGNERSFYPSGEPAVNSRRTKWPVAKWLFFLGFIFPLLWLFGSFLLFSGLRRLSADAQKEDQSANSKPDTHLYDANAESITHLIAQEVVWSKRCAWAVAFFAAVCFIVLGVLKGLGM